MEAARVLEKAPEVIRLLYCRLSEPELVSRKHCLLFFRFIECVTAVAPSLIAEQTGDVLLGLVKLVRCSSSVCKNDQLYEDAIGIISTEDKM